MQRVVIIGNGIAGITAARHIRKRSDSAITVISAESDHFYSRTALMYIYMGHMRYEHTKPYEDWFWRKNGIDLVLDYVKGINTGSKSLALESGKTIEYDTLIIATGSTSNRFGWPGQDLDAVQGLYSLQDLEAMERDTAGVKHAVVVGGGLIGIEMAEMLNTREIGVTMLVRESAWMSHVFPAEESAVIERHIREHGIDLRMGTELDRIMGDSRASGVVTKDGDSIDCQFVGLTVGVSPNIGFLDGSGIETERGVLVDAQLRTSVDGVYAIGDCAQVRDVAPGRRPVEALWYVGRRMGETVARTICGEPTRYDPGFWFNSAKFFDVEYQVYGAAPAQIPDDMQTLLWQDTANHRLIRINYSKADDTVLGFNLLGVRYRHEVCKAWIEQRRDVAYVLENLGAANFDPEFYREFEAEVVAQYNESAAKKVRLKRRRGLAGALEMIGARP